MTHNSCLKVEKLAIKQSNDLNNCTIKFAESRVILFQLLKSGISTCWWEEK